MKRLYRRQRQQYFFATVLGVIGVVNLLFFLILYGPVRSEYFRLLDSIQRTHTAVQSRHQKIAQLEKLNAQLETSAQDRRELYTMHFIPRNAGWSEILPQLDAMVREAGVKNLRKDYNISDSAQYGLYSVTIRIPVNGPYSNVVNFIKDVENAGTLFIIDSINVQGSNVPGAAEVAMALNLETFFYQ